MAVLQPTPRRSIPRGRTVANNLIADSQQPAPSFLQATWHLTDEEAAKGSVQYRRSTLLFMKGSVMVKPEEYFWLVESEKYAGYFFVVVYRNGQWLCSGDEHVAARCIKAAQAAQAALLAPCPLID